MSVDPAKEHLLVVAGAGGFIGGALVRYFHDRGRRRIRAVDKKPLADWYQHVPDVECVRLDLAVEADCRRAVDGAAEVYNLAADMGGMGFIEQFRIACLRNFLIDAHLIEAASVAGVERYFFASSACVYNTDLQSDPDVTALKESDAYPAMAERGYGWEKLLGEMVCQEYWAERGLRTAIARLHNVYGPHGCWQGGREKAPAALCRKVVEAVHEQTGRIVIWGDGKATRSFTYIEDCVVGIDRITHCDALIATPVNLGSSELVSIDEVVSRIERIAGVKLERQYDPGAPTGVAGRNSDNTFIERVLGWEPSTTLDAGLAATYAWIESQYRARYPRRSTAESAAT